jgi:hypothetical protein
MILIELKIIKNFKDMGLFKTFCSDCGGLINKNTITFVDHYQFIPIVKLIPTFFTHNHSNYITIKEIKNETTIT